MKLLALNLLAMCQYNEIITSRVGNSQGIDGKDEAQPALPLREIYFSDLHLANDLVVLKIVNFRGKSVFSDAVRQLEEDFEWRRSAREIGECPGTKDADNVDLAGLGLDNRVVAKQDGLAPRRRLATFFHPLFRHAVSVLLDRKPELSHILLPVFFFRHETAPCPVKSKQRKRPHAFAATERPIVKHILIVDDEEAVCWSLQRALGREGHSVSVAASAEQAFSLLNRQRADVLILDVRLPGMDGLTALGRIRRLSPDLPVIVVTAFGDLPTAVRAVEGGAFDYLAKPFDLQQAIECVNRALQRRPAPEAAPEISENAPGPEEIVGRSPAMQNVFKRIALVASRDACVLITGESGTGKELVARAIHRYSARRDHPFLPVHVAALNPNLVESELFGHTRGAFTGAAQARPGLLALADGGTVFLDELADIPLPVQVKLLRVLEHNEVLPVGGNQPQPLNIRILTATHQDLTRCVAEGRFRHDLFFRLNVFQIALPALRDRPEDIEALAEHFLRRFEPRALPLLPETLRSLQSLPWFGNVRELRNALEHAAIVARGGPLLPEHFPTFAADLSCSSPAEQLAAMVRKWLAERVRASGSTPPDDLYAELLHCVEPALLDEVMRRVQGNRWVAAQWLGLNRATVRKKLTLYDLYQAQSAANADEEEGDASEPTSPER